MKVICYKCPSCDLHVWTRSIPKTALLCIDCFLAATIKNQDGPGLYHGPWPVLTPAVEETSDEIVWTAADKARLTNAVKLAPA